MSKSKRHRRSRRRRRRRTIARRRWVAVVRRNVNATMFYWSADWSRASNPDLELDVEGLFVEAWG